MIKEIENIEIKEIKQGSKEIEISLPCFSIEGDSVYAGKRYILFTSIEERGVNLEDLKDGICMAYAIPLDKSKYVIEGVKDSEDECEYPCYLDVREIKGGKYFVAVFPAGRYGGFHIFGNAISMIDSIIIIIGLPFPVLPTKKDIKQAGKEIVKEFVKDNKENKKRFYKTFYKTCFKGG